MCLGGGDGFQMHIFTVSQTITALKINIMWSI